MYCQLISDCRCYSNSTPSNPSLDWMYDPLLTAVRQGSITYGCLLSVLYASGSNSASTISSSSQHIHALLVAASDVRQVDCLTQRRRLSHTVVLLCPRHLPFVCPVACHISCRGHLMDTWKIIRVLLSVCFIYDEHPPTFSKQIYFQIRLLSFSRTLSQPVPSLFVCSGDYSR